MKTLDEYLQKYYDSSTSIRKADFPFPAHEGEAEALFYKVAGKEVFAFIGYPETPCPEGGYPAVVLVHGGGGQAFYEWVFEWTKRGFVAIAPDYDSQYAVDTEHTKEYNENCGIRGYGSLCKENLTEEHPWVYFSVLETMKAIDALLLDKRVNPEKIMIDGISWGGFLSLIVCGTEKRLRAGIIDYSSAFISEGSWGQGEMQLKKLSPAELSDYNAHFDPQSYLGNIKIPMLFSAGMQDICFFVNGRKKTTDRIKGEKYFSYRKFFPHGHYEIFAEPVNYCFAKHILCGGEFLQAADKERKRNSIKTALVYTREDCRKSDIVSWEETSDTESLPKDAKSYFYTYEDENGVKVSSDVIFR